MLLLKTVRLPSILLCTRFFDYVHRCLYHVMFRVTPVAPHQDRNRFSSSVIINCRSRSNEMKFCLCVCIHTFGIGGITEHHCVDFPTIRNVNSCRTLSNIMLNDCVWYYNRQQGVREDKLLLQYV